MRGVDGAEGVLELLLTGKQAAVSQRTDVQGFERPQNTVSIATA